MKKIKLLENRNGVGVVGDVVEVSEERALRWVDEGIASDNLSKPEPDDPKPDLDPDDPKPVKGKKKDGG